MKLQKIILAAAAAAVLALSASCRATGEDGGGGGDTGPKPGDPVIVRFNPNTGVWPSTEPEGTEEKDFQQTFGDFLSLPTEELMPSLEWTGTPRRWDHYQFVGWYKLPDGEESLRLLTVDETTGEAEQVPPEWEFFEVTTDTIVSGDLAGQVVYALWREPPKKIRVTFKKYFGPDVPETEVFVKDLAFPNNGVSSSEVTSLTTRDFYHADTTNWYEVENGALSNNIFTFDTQIPEDKDNLVVVMKWIGNSLKLTFTPGAGLTAPSDITLVYPETLASRSLAVPALTRDYYTLDGWYNGSEKLTTTTLLTPNTNNNSKVYNYTATWNPTDNYYLESLSVVITTETANKITGFTSSSVDYQALVANGKTFAVKAKAINPSAKISITVDGVETTIKNIVSGANGVTLSAVNAPAIGSQKVINVAVQKPSGGSTQTYQITVDIDDGTLDKWTGTAYNKLNGGTSSDGKVVTQVVAFNADRSIKGVATFDNSTLSDTRAWTLKMPQSPQFRPVYFIVSFSDGTDNFVSDEVTPVGAPLAPQPAASGTGIAINATKTGIRLADANEFAQLGDSANRDKDFALGGDIDLTNTGTAWNGPTGYIGHFYGNGYTIKGLVLNKTSGDTGLFATVGNNAVIENFTLEVSTQANSEGNFPARTGSAHFGGVVGYTSSGASILLKNIKVKGRLDYGPMDINGFILAGSLIGETNNGSNATIENCVSELDITLAEGVGSGALTLGFGGLIGKAYGTLTIKNSYYTGDITVAHNADKNLCAGGIIGVSNNCTLTIENCYSSGLVSATNNSITGRKVFAGGLVGWIESRPDLVVVKNSAALGARAVAATTTTYFQSNRIAAIYETVFRTGFGNNYALKNMLTGNDPTAQPQDDAGDADTSKGLGKTLAEFKQQTTWINAAPAGLGFDSAIWDFDGLTKSGADFYWPRLK